MRAIVSTGGAMLRRRLVQRLALLCRSGAGLHAIASPLCDIVGELVDADAGLLIWLGGDGVPAGFYHQTAPAEVKDQFVTQFDALFNKSEEITALSLIQADGPAIGKMLAPGMQDRFERENIYRYLCQPINHRYMIDMVVKGRAGFFGFNSPARPFGATTVKALEPLLPLLAAALVRSNQPVRWHSVSPGIAHLLVSLDGRILHAIDDEAEVVLRNSHLLGQNVAMIGQTRAAPGFAQSIAMQLQGKRELETDLAVPDGRLLCRARRTRMFGANGETAEEGILIALDLQFAECVALIGHLFYYDLTSLQQCVLLDALEGFTRGESRQRRAIGEEAMKKHLQSIYRETGAETWEGLNALRKPLLDEYAAQIVRRWTAAVITEA